MAVVRMRHNERREKESTEERERRSAADRCDALKVMTSYRQKERQQMKEKVYYILDKTRKLRRNRRHSREKKHVWPLIGCAGSSNQKSSKRLG